MTMIELFELIENDAPLAEIKQGIDDNAEIIKRPHGYQPLNKYSLNVFLCAAGKGRQDILEYLISTGFDADSSDLVSAAYMSLSVNQDTVVFLLEQMTSETLEGAGAIGILQMSVSKGYDEIVDWFTDHGISAEEQVEVVAAGDLAGHNDAI
jgi:hypothetical protein